jgi:Ca-activated chloride channel homolog
MTKEAYRFTSSTAVSYWLCSTSLSAVWKRALETFSDVAALSRPLAVVFALNLSGSLKPDETNTLQSAARQFTGLLQGDSVFAALAINQNIKIYQDFTADAQRLEQAFARMNRFEGSTRLYDALDRAVTMLSRRAPSTRKGRPLRRVVVVITNGFDSASSMDRRELIRRASAAHVSVYSITLPSYALSPTPARERLLTSLDTSRIVMATGGRDFSADARDFTPVFKALAEKIRASYALSYYPDKRDGQYRELRVTTTRPGLHLRVSRNGYTAPAK